MLKSGRQLPDPNRPGHWATGLDAQRLADAQRQGPASTRRQAHPRPDEGIVRRISQRSRPPDRSAGGALELGGGCRKTCG